MSSESRTHATGGETARAAEECSEAGERAAVRQVRVCASAGLLGAVAFASSLVVLHAVVADINWMRHYVSGPRTRQPRPSIASFWLWEIAAAVKLLQMFSHHALHTSSV